MTPPRMIPSDVPGTLRRILAAWPGTAESLAEDTGTSPGTLSRWLNAKRDPGVTRWRIWIEAAGPVLEAALAKADSQNETQFENVAQNENGSGE